MDISILLKADYVFPPGLFSFSPKPNQVCRGEPSEAKGKGQERCPHDISKCFCYPQGKALKNAPALFSLTSPHSLMSRFSVKEAGVEIQNTVMELVEFID